MINFSTYSEEERLAASHGLIKKAQSFAGEDICAVLAFVAHRRILVALEGGIEVHIRERIEKEVGACPCFWIRVVVVVNVVSIEELARIIRRISLILEEGGQVVVIETLRDELGESACKRGESIDILLN